MSRDLSRLAEFKEREGVKKGLYPPEWIEVARQIKELAGWSCERCGVAHGNVPNVLTVHHLDGNKRNLERWNLAALCQRCHLRVQSRVDWYQDLLDGVHSRWLAVHIVMYNEWAEKKNRLKLTLRQIVDRSYENEWVEQTVIDGKEWDWGVND